VPRLHLPFAERLTALVAWGEARGAERCDLCRDLPGPAGGSGREKEVAEGSLSARTNLETHEICDPLENAVSREQDRTVVESALCDMRVGSRD